ncbi:hypothetical protein R69746_08365 [Paraburkholderia aspalathi]|nr:hypothetical protein R69746_08365 [Paraburkholderia aspalathi]
MSYSMFEKTGAFSPMPALLEYRATSISFSLRRSKERAKTEFARPDAAGVRGFQRI